MWEVNKSTRFLRFLLFLKKKCFETDSYNSPLKSRKSARTADKAYLQRKYRNIQI
jgi:hypothetical protein